MRQRTKNQLSTLFLILILLFLTLGYAYLSTNLNITGTSNINNPTWDIHFENIQVTAGSVEAAQPVIDTAKTTVSYEVTLNKPGDFYEFTVDAVNDGTIDAMIESVNSTINDNPITELPTYLDYFITYSDGLQIENNQLLSSGSRETYKVRIEFKKDISALDLPTSAQEFQFNLILSKRQATSSAKSVFHPVPASELLKTNPDGTTPEEKSPYVNYVYGDNQTILCRVLYDNTSEYGIQLVSDESTETISLDGQSQYNDAVYILNQAAGTYLQSSDIADRARSLGCNPNSNSESTGPTNMFYNNGYNYADGTYKDQDSDYETDWNQIHSLGIYEVNSWLASREANVIGSYRLGVRRVNFVTYSSTSHDYVLSNSELVRLYSNSYYSDYDILFYTASSGFRPVFHLKPTVKVVGGLGTKTNPYILGV